MNREGTPWFKKLTVYSGVVTGQGFGKSGAKTAHAGAIVYGHGFGKINLILSLIVLALLVFYVFISNFIVSQKYALNAARLELGGISADLAVERNGQAVEPAITKVMNYAQSAGMIEVGTGDSIVEDSGFAVSIPNVR